MVKLHQQTGNQINETTLNSKRIKTGSEFFHFIYRSKTHPFNKNAIFRGVGVGGGCGGEVYIQRCSDKIYFQTGASDSSILKYNFPLQILAFHIYPHYSTSFRLLYTLKRGRCVFAFFHRLNWPTGVRPPAM